MGGAAWSQRSGGKGMFFCFAYAVFRAACRMREREKKNCLSMQEKKPCVVVPLKSAIKKKPMPHKRGLSIRQNSSAEGLNHLIRIHVICIARNNVKASSGPAAEVYLRFTAADFSPSCASAAAIC